MIWADLVWGEPAPPGRRLLAGALRAAASMLSVPYGAAVLARGALHDFFPGRAKRVPVPVLCVGNLTAGGTGKTPAVAWLCRELVALGRKPLIASRGYGGEAEKGNDEARLLAEELPGVPHVQGPDRHSVALAGIGRHGADCVVLDDGFQHRRLFRDLDIVLVDCLDPFGGGRLLPRGRLREPVSALSRAGAVILTRSDAVAGAEADRISDAVAARTGACLARAVHRPTGVTDLRGEETRPPESLAGARAHLAMAVGNPASFRRAAERLGVRVAGESRFPDHHRYTVGDLAEIRRAAARGSADMILVTRKDAVKIRDLPEAGPGGIPVRVLAVRFEVVSGLDTLLARIRDAAGGAHGETHARA